MAFFDVNTTSPWFNWIMNQVVAKLVVMAIPAILYLVVNIFVTVNSIEDDRKAMFKEVIGEIDKRESRINSRINHLKWRMERVEHEVDRLRGRTNAPGPDVSMDDRKDPIPGPEGDVTNMRYAIGQKIRRFSVTKRKDEVS